MAKPKSRKGKENKKQNRGRGGGGGYQQIPKPKPTLKQRVAEKIVLLREKAAQARKHCTKKLIVSSVLVVILAIAANWYWHNADFFPDLSTMALGSPLAVAKLAWNARVPNDIIMSNTEYCDKKAKTGDIVYFYGTPKQMWYELYDLGVGWFVYDFTHWLIGRPMHSGIVVETNGRKYLMHSCGTKVWFQGLKAHLRYRVYMKYDIKIQPLKWKKPKGIQKKIDKFLKKYVDKPYRKKLNVSMIPQWQIPSADSPKAKEMKTQPWLFPFGQHPNYTMTYDYYWAHPEVRNVKDGYSCAEMVVLFYDMIGLFDKEHGYAPLAYLPYNVWPSSPSFRMLKGASFKQDIILELRDPRYQRESKSWTWWFNRCYENTKWVLGFEIPERGLYD
jgi:hypothetical protein